MPNLPRRPPQGRGQRKGPDAKVNQGESNALRRELIPDQGWYISSLPASTGPALASVGTSNRLRFFVVERPAEAVKISEIRTAVRLGIASSKVRVALYRYVRSPVKRLVKLAGSEAIFDSSSAGVKTKVLEQPLSVGATERLFIGVHCNDSTVGLLGTLSTGANVNRVFNTLYTDAYTTLPAEIVLSQLTKDPAQPIFEVSYLSAEAADVI